jgi:hypothetical protein
MLFVGLWFLFAGGGIAWWAQIAGFILAGLLRPPRRRYWPRDVDGGIPGLRCRELYEAQQMIAWRIA